MDNLEKLATQSTRRKHVAVYENNLLPTKSLSGEDMLVTSLCALLRFPAISDWWCIVTD